MHEENKVLPKLTTMTNPMTAVRPAGDQNSEEHYEEDATLSNMTSTGNAKAAREPTARKKMNPTQLVALHSIRRSIDASKCKEFFCNWKNIKYEVVKFGPNPAPLNAHAYTVCPIASWVPHKLFVDYKPYCPRCKAKVDMIKTEWLRTPKIMHTISGFSFLDTVNYHCFSCERQFLATDLNSLSMYEDEEVRKAFSIHLLPKCAIDADLYNFIVSMKHQSTSSIKGCLDSIRMGKYVSDANDYFIRGIAIKRNNNRGTQQMETNMHRFMTRNSNVPNTVSRSNNNSFLPTRDRLQIKRLEGRLEQTRPSPIEFGKLKSMQQPVIKKLHSIGILNGNDLLAATTIDNSAKVTGTATKEFEIGFRNGFGKDWKTRIGRFVEKVQQARQSQLECFKKVEEELKELYEKRDQMKAEHDAKRNANSGAAATATENVKPSNEGQLQLPDFPSMTNQLVVRRISEHIIESVLNSNFQSRKAGMQHRMANLGGTILSLDANYKVAQKITVVMKDQTRTKPFKCLVTVMNEDNMVIWWGLLRSEESITEIEQHLRRLKVRLHRINQRNNQKLEAIYVDNCCSIRNKLQSIFGQDVDVLLDLFHWLERWDELLRKPASDGGRRFKGFMSRAVLVITTKEWEQKRDALAKELGRDPTNTEIALKCNKVTVQSHEHINASVRKVISFFMLLDSERVSNSAEDQITPPQLILKDAAIVRAVAKKQMKHAKCLLDPQCGVHFCLDCGNTKVKADFTARGTGKNKRLFRDGNRMFLFGAALGISRAERILWEYLDEHNNRANIRRCGRQDYNYSNLEAMALCNSLATDASCTLPFPDISLPTTEKSNEQFGFELYKEADLTQDAEPYTTPRRTNDRPNDETLWDTLNPDDCEHVTRVFDPKLLKRQNTRDAFDRLTGGKPWTPISLTSNDAVAVEERRLFDEWYTDFDRNANLRSKKGYHQFVKKWNLEAGKRVLDKMEDEAVVEIRRKSLAQLQQYYDELQDRKDAAVNATAETMAGVATVYRSLKKARLETDDKRPTLRKPLTFSQPTSNRGRRHLPLGAPMVQNQQITMPFSQIRRGGGTAPFTTNLTTPRMMPQPVPDHGMTYQINEKVFCKFCGTKRTNILHTDRCYKILNPQTECAKCGFTKMRHDRSNKTFGYYCNFLPPSDERVQQYQKDATQLIEQYRSEFSARVANRNVQN